MKNKCFVAVLVVVLFIVCVNSLSFGEVSSGIVKEGSTIAEEGLNIPEERINVTGDEPGEPGDNHNIIEEGSDASEENPGIDKGGLNEVKATEYDVYIDQRMLSNKGILNGSTVMLPMEEFFESLNLKVRLYEDSIQVTSYNIYIYILKDCRIIFLNAVPFAISSPVAFINGIYYFPLDLAVNLLNMSASVDETAKKIILGDKFNCSTESNLDSLFPASPVFCTIKKGHSLYNNIAGSLISFCSEDTRAEILMDSSLVWYKVKTDKGQVFWVKRDALIIDTDYLLLNDIPTRTELEMYAELKEFKSDTDFFVWVDISRQLVYIYLRDGNSWSLHRIMQCSTGKNESPTTRGLYKISDRGEWFYSEIFQSGAKNWVRFNGAYLFHSIAMDRNQQVKDDALGDRFSAGCIRLSLEDSRWFYENIAKGTSVYVN